MIVGWLLFAFGLALCVVSVLAYPWISGAGWLIGALGIILTFGGYEKATRERRVQNILDR